MIGHDLSSARHVSVLFLLFFHHSSRCIFHLESRTEHYEGEFANQSLNLGPRFYLYVAYFNVVKKREIMHGMVDVCSTYQIHVPTNKIY